MLLRRGKGQMSKSLKVVGIGGSLGPTSTSLAALRIALEGADEAGSRTEILNIASLKLPLFVPRAEKVPVSARKLADAVYAANGLLWSSPLYHGTISGSFKNALDWLELLGTREPPYLTNKVVGLISTAGGVQGLQAVNTMEFVVRALRGWTVPLVIPVPRAMQAFDENGQARDPKVAEQLRSLGQEVARAAGQFKVSGYCEYDVQNIGAERQPG